MADDPWGDKATRAHLRPDSFTWPLEREAEPEPEPEAVDTDIDAVLEGDTLDTDAIRTFMDAQPEEAPEDPTEPTVVDSDVATVDNTVTEESDDTPQGWFRRREPVPDSISGRVWGMFKTFPKERFHRNEVAATLDITSDQATSSVLHLQRLFLPIHGDGSGNYWYDEDQPVNEVIRKRAEWYAQYRKPKEKKTKTMQKSGPSKTKAATSNRIPSTAELLQEMGFQERAIIIFNALARFAGVTESSPPTNVRVSTQQTFTPEEAKLFPTKQIVSAVNRYLETIDSVTQGGPMKTLKQHPDAVPAEVREQANAALMTYYGVNRRLSPAPPRRVAVTTPVREESAPSRSDLERVEWEPAIEEPRSPERRPTMTDDLIDSVDEDRLAKALANGMWARYEWALTALGKAQEQLAGMQEAVRVRDQEIERLRGYLATQDQFSIRDVARDLLAPDENGSR